MIDKKQVEYIAQLARLKLTPQEQDAMTGQLSNILEYVDTLNRVDTTAVEPTAYVVAEHDPLREDAPRPSLSHEHILENGPVVKKDHFAVPKVIG